MRVRFTVNGARHDVDVAPGRTLADVLATECGVAECRVACADGTCGACAMVVDGGPVRACLMLAVQASGTWVRGM